MPFDLNDVLFQRAIEATYKLELVWLHLVQTLAFLVGYLVMVSPETTWFSKCNFWI